MFRHHGDTKNASPPWRYQFCFDVTAIPKFFRCQARQTSPDKSLHGWPDHVENVMRRLAHHFPFGFPRRATTTTEAATAKTATTTTTAATTAGAAATTTTMRRLVHYF